MKICFFTKHEINWGSTRNRIGVYLDYLIKRGYTFRIIYCVSNKISQRWIGDKSRNLTSMRIYSFWQSRIIKHLKLIWLIIIAKDFDAILIQKVNLIYPLVWFLRLRNKNLIFDFDDLCFWDLESIQKKKLTFKQKLYFWKKGIQNPTVLRLYKHIIAGNNYLAEIAIKIKDKDSVSVIPTPINCELYRPQNERPPGSLIVIGWSGTGENHLRHLELLVKPLEYLKRNYEFVFKVVGAMHSKRIKSLFSFLGKSFICIDWVEPEHLPDIICSFDIGVMPLRDDHEARGKCGFKALEYMASGVATIVSCVGINKEIIKNNLNGFLAKDEEEWVKKLSSLIIDNKLRNEFSYAGRRTVEEIYSLSKNFQLFQDVIEKCSRDNHDMCS